MSIGIYKFQNLITLEVYIGQSVALEARYQKHKRDWLNGTTQLYQAMQQYGWDNFSYEIVELCSKEQLNERECYWITYYNSYKYGYNMTKGGSNRYSVDNEAINLLYDAGKTPKEIAIELLLGLSTVYDHLQGNSKHPEQSNNGIIYQYDLQGNFIKAWPYIQKASDELGIAAISISRVIRHERNSAGGFQWSKEKKDKLEPLIKTSNPRTIYQYDLKK